MTQGTGYGNRSPRRHQRRASGEVSTARSPCQDAWARNCILRRPKQDAHGMARVRGRWRWDASEGGSQLGRWEGEGGMPRCCPVAAQGTMLTPVLLLLLKSIPVLLQGPQYCARFSPMMTLINHKSLCLLRKATPAMWKQKGVGAWRRKGWPQTRKPSRTPPHLPRLPHSARSAVSILRPSTRLDVPLAPT